MKKKLATEHIDFADSEFKSWELIENNLKLYLTSWNNKTLEIIFFNIIEFSFKLGDVPKDLYEISNCSDYLASLEKKNKSSSHKFKLFRFEDIDDFPFIEIIAESVIATKE